MITFIMIEDYFRKGLKSNEQITRQNLPHLQKVDYNTRKRSTLVKLQGKELSIMTREKWEDMAAI